MKVLFVTAECWPFVKTGGLGDVSYALPKALKREGEYAYLYGYNDDVEIFTFFSNAVLESLKRIDFFPDVINLNDWHKGMIPLFLKENYS